MGPSERAFILPQRRYRIVNLHLPALPARVVPQPPSRRSLCSTDQAKGRSGNPVIYSGKFTTPPKLGRLKSARVSAARLWRLELNFYLNAPKALLKVLKHFMSTICSLINSTSKLCRIDERPAKGTFPTLSLEPVDSLVDLLATFRACEFQR